MTAALSLRCCLGSTSGSCLTRSLPQEVVVLISSSSTTARRDIQTIVRFVVFLLLMDEPCPPSDSSHSSAMSLFRSMEQLPVRRFQQGHAAAARRVARQTAVPSTCLGRLPREDEGMQGPGSTHGEGSTTVPSAAGSCCDFYFCIRTWTSLPELLILA